MLLRKPQIHFFFSLLPWAAQTAQTEAFMFQNVAYKPAINDHSILTFYLTDYKHAHEGSWLLKLFVL